MRADYKPLQNGSDIRGVAAAAFGEKVNLGEEEAKRLSFAFARWLSEKYGRPCGNLTVSVGHDSRITAEKLKKAVCDGLAAAGARVYDCGLASTPAMFMSTLFEDFDCDGAIMITASHLPYNRNGFKYFSRDGGLDKKDISALIETAESGEAARASDICGQSKDVVKKDLISTYSAHLRQMIAEQTGVKEKDKPLAGLKIIVDAGNGAGGFYEAKVLAPLGADTTGSIYLEPDGMFPNHEPNPENKKAMEAISNAVVENRADLGLIFDTDVDRASAVDSSGREISRNAIVAMAAALIAADHPGTTVVTDSITSDQLTDYLQDCLGLKHLRYKRGYRNVINKAAELNDSGVDCQLAIETSGHAAYKENYFLDDGAFLATKIVIKMAQLKKAGAGIDALISSLKEPAEAMEYRFSIEREDFADYADRVLAALRDWAAGEEGGRVGASLAEPNYEGVRINFRGRGLRGWCLLRKSLHDPQMPLNIEVTEGSCKEIFEILKQALAGFGLK